MDGLDGDLDNDSRNPFMFDEDEDEDEDEEDDDDDDDMPRSRRQISEDEDDFGGLSRTLCCHRVPCVVLEFNVRVFKRRILLSSSGLPS